MNIIERKIAAKIIRIGEDGWFIQSRRSYRWILLDRKHGWSLNKKHLKEEILKDGFKIEVYEVKESIKVFEVLYKNREDLTVHGYKEIDDITLEVLIGYLK